MEQRDRAVMLWEAVRWRQKWVTILGSVMSHDVAIYIALQRGNAVSMKDIFLALGCSYLRVTQVIKDLEEAGLITVANSRTDRRMKEIWPTRELFQLLESFLSEADPAQRPGAKAPSHSRLNG